MDKTAPNTGWEKLVKPFQSDWIWKDRKLYNKEYLSQAEAKPREFSFLRRVILKRAYATHNNSRKVQAVLNPLLQNLPKDDWGINIGAGNTRLGDRIINIDIVNCDAIHIVGTGYDIPLRDESISLAISQEVLEHTESPQRIIQEVWRILKPGGTFYCQLPFVMGIIPDLQITGGSPGKAWWPSFLDLIGSCKLLILVSVTGPVFTV